jgi:hypothetical protein
VPGTDMPMNASSLNNGLRRAEMQAVDGDVLV